jgi:hypothetical protein
MAEQIINIGGHPGDGTGDPIRVAFDKTNQNFQEIYADIATISNGSVPIGTYVTTVAGRSGNVSLSIADVQGSVSSNFVTNQIQLAITAEDSKILASQAASPLSFRAADELP